MRAVLPGVVLVGVTVLSACSDDGQASDATRRCQPVMVGEAETDYRQYDVVRVMPDGVVEQITEDRRSFGPAVSPDGTWLAFTRGAPGSAAEDGYTDHGIVTSDLDGTVVAEFERPSGRNDSGPSISPDGEHVAFVRTDPDDWESKVVVARKDGSDQRELGDPFEFFGQHQQTAWSPDGEEVATVTSGREGPTLIVVDVDSGEVEHRRGLPEMGPVHFDWPDDSSTVLVSGSSYSTPYGPTEIEVEGDEERPVKTGGAILTNGFYAEEDGLLVLRFGTPEAPTVQRFDHLASDGTVRRSGPELASDYLVGALNATPCFSLTSAA